MKRILLIEDEVEIRLLYTELLTEAGYFVEQAPDGNVGLEKATSEKWDLILLDIMLPGQDGVAVMEHLNSNTEYEIPTVIAITNLKIDAVTEKLLNLGVAKIIVKSDVAPKDIVDSVKEFI